MTIPEAAQLVIQAGAMGTGGDVFLLDMGEPVKIVDLAKQMIRLSDLRPMDENGVGDIEILFTGLRPGEKLYEELLIDAEGVETTEHPRILKSFERYYSLREVHAAFLQILKCYEQEKETTLINILKKYVDSYENNF